MKKLSILTTIMVVIAFAIGFYVGYNKTQPSPTQSHSNERLEKSSQALINKAQRSQANQNENADTLKQALKNEQAKSQALEDLVSQQEQQLTAPKAEAQNSAPEQEVIPATDYERSGYVTNLVHQFNADNASTEIVDVTCENGFCTLDANVSAGTQTNPEIAKLMKFLDDKRLPRYYHNVSLLNVTKDDDHSSIKFSLN